jgi:hypothetical protein
MTKVSWDEMLQCSVRSRVLASSIALGFPLAVVMQAFSRMHLRQVSGSQPYGAGIDAVLAISLPASVYAIMRWDSYILVGTSTVGVVVKAVLAGSVIALAYSSTGYFGVAVVRMHPLAVTAPFDTAPCRSGSGRFSWLMRPSISSWSRWSFAPCRS